MEKPTKRSITIAGHATSISLEPSFWAALSDMAAAHNMSLTDIIAEIDERPRNSSLTSALRVAVLNWARGT
ncbi:MAG: ribbon-helix-helix domain-containing protein [Pseudomonadota bacterium]|nr:ribbon-helix-helix domain-containing protein [Pseudomonadota bacterium]MEC9139152.1 ribbon-helix-helix domain-containing protein [Pseudomonadota bacterium]